jgi:Protein of unknown function (DUF3040)
MTAQFDAAEFAMLSDHDRRTLAEIERHLEGDPGLCRAFGRYDRRPSRIRRFWYALLLVSLLLMVGLAALGVQGPAVECGALAAAIGMGLRMTRNGVELGAGRGPVPDRRP